VGGARAGSGRRACSVDTANPPVDIAGKPPPVATSAAGAPAISISSRCRGRHNCGGELHEATGASTQAIAPSVASFARRRQSPSWRRPESRRSDVIWSIQKPEPLSAKARIELRAHVCVHRASCTVARSTPRARRRSCSGRVIPSCDEAHQVRTLRDEWSVRCQAGRLMLEQFVRMGLTRSLERPGCPFSQGGCGGRSPAEFRRNAVVSVYLSRTGSMLVRPRSRRS